MIGFVKYAGVSAKLYALSSELLTPEDYKNLVNQKAVRDVVSYIQSTKMYSDTMGNLNPDEIHRRDLENLLQEDLLKDMKKIFTFFVTFDKDFMHLLFYRYEVENLKLALRNFINRKEIKVEESKKIFFNLGERATIDPVKISNSKNQDEVLDNLAGTSYQEVVRNVFSSYKKSTAVNLIAVLENAIDGWLFSKIISASKNLGTKDQVVVKELTGERADMIDIERIARAKAFYDLKPEELYNSLLSFHFRLKPDDLHAMCDAKEIKEMLDVLKAGPYAEIFKDMSEDNFIDRITLAERRFLQRKARESITKLGNFSIAVYFHYFLLKEYEIMDLSTITEGVRYGLKVEEIKERLINEF
ncbi:MAG: V-type ATPase subunit [Thermotogae bacterium]|jgi:V/A-type H+-transporting ATPase subunit C|nr:V-type ATPase subunit [Thermotogota bacterium]MCL5032510.1 V-type ATPase subunit [Thermotogota bacterium]